MTSLRALLAVRSGSTSTGHLIPTLAALEVAGIDTELFEMGQGETDSALEWILSALGDGRSERKLGQTLEQHPPDVLLAFDPTSACVLAEKRRSAGRPIPLIAVIAGLDVDREWQHTEADRYLTVDDGVAAALEELEIDPADILPIGALCEHDFVRAGRTSRAQLRKRFGFDPDKRAVLVEVAGLGFTTAGDMAMNLGLTGPACLYLFDAGSDADAAAALRQKVPGLAIEAKLFGATGDAAALWRCADVVVAQPKERVISRVLALGSKLVAYSGPGAGAEPLEQALAEREIGVVARMPLLVASSVEAALALETPPLRTVGVDGAAQLAAMTRLVATHNDAIAGERQRQRSHDLKEKINEVARWAEAASSLAGAAGGLEDLDGSVPAAVPADAPNPQQLEALDRDLHARLDQLNRTVADAREAAERWERRAEAVPSTSPEKEREAERNADHERARMHGALAEMSEIEVERKRLAQAIDTARQFRRSHPRGAEPTPPPATPRRAAATRAVDDELDGLKRSAGDARDGARSARPSPASTSIDDQLAALKRKLKRS